MLNVRATAAGTAEDAVAISFVDGGAGAATTVTYTAGATLEIETDLTATTAVTAQEVADAISAQTSEFEAFLTGADGLMAAADALVTETTDLASLTLTADSAGSDYNNVTVNIVAGVSGAGNSAAYDAGQRAVTITVDPVAPQDLAALVGDINTDLAGIFTATASAVGFVNATGDDADVTDNTANTGGRALKGDFVFSIGGATGREVFNFESGASVNQISAAINLVSDATGVMASYSTAGLTLNSTTYGTAAVVDTEIISEGAGGTFGAGLSAARAEGTDIVASVNGVNANGDGNSFSINTATLDLSITVNDGSSTSFQFSITGGGALFQLGPDVVSNQQARMGVQSLNTASLGGASGRLHELASGGSKALATDPNGAYRVVDDVISKVTRLRGRLGAFQRTTLETNIASLNDTLVNLTAAESSIRDADFAKESSALTRAQILVQSGTSVLAIANSNPQSVLSLLR